MAKENHMLSYNYSQNIIKSQATQAMGINTIDGKKLQSNHY